jgi:DUF4097 and DUF4098 domain-containing protein YvlB
MRAVLESLQTARAQRRPARQWRLMSACMCAGVLGWALAQAASAETFQRRVPADSRGEVQIVNVSGEVQVRGWDRNEVLVDAELGARVERVDVRSEPQRTIIEVVAKAGGQGASDLTVHVPTESSLTIRSVSADQSVENVHGAQRLQAVSGSISTELWRHELEARTVSGEVSVRGRAGSTGDGQRSPGGEDDSGAGLLRVTTVSGGMRLDQVGAELELNTVAGNIEVTADRLRRGRIKTTNGDVDLTTGLAPEARLDAEAINGELRLHLRGAVDASFEVETFNGRIDNCFGPEPQRTREFAPGRELRFKEGDGRGLVRIKTLNGGIEICKK